MYEKTIASEHRIWQIVIPTSKTKVLDLLTVADRADYDSLISVGRAYRAYNDRVTPRTPVDGYVICHSTEFYVSSSVDSSAAEDLAPISIPYSNPVHYWLDSTFIRSGSDVSATLRVFFS